MARSAAEELHGGVGDTMWHRCQTRGPPRDRVAEPPLIGVLAELVLQKGFVLLQQQNLQLVGETPAGSIPALQIRCPLGLAGPNLPTHPGDGCLQGGKAGLVLRRGIALTPGIPPQL